MKCLKIFFCVILAQFLFGVDIMADSSKLALNQDKQTPGQSDTLNLKDFNNDEFVVIFTFGQSNSANHGQGLYTCKNEVYNWCDGKMFRAKDPLQGAEGKHGSVWTKLSDKLIDQKLAKKILIVPIGIGGTVVGQWAKGGKLNIRIESTIKALTQQGIIIDYIFWHQGESDNVNNTKKEDYVKRFESIRTTIRENKVEAPIFMAIVSYCPREDLLLNKHFGCDPVIQNAQLELIKKYKDILPGPNTDILDKCYYRHDGIHFSVLGVEKHAELWLKAIKSQLKKDIRK